MSRRHRISYKFESACKLTVMCVIPSFVVCRVALFRKLQSSVKMTIILRRNIISYILYSHGWFWFLLWLIPSFIWFNVNNIPRVFVFIPIVYMYHTLFLLWWRSLVFVNITKCQISYSKCNYDTEYQPSGWFRIGHDIGNYSSPSSTEHEVVCVLKDGEHAFNTLRPKQMTAIFQTTFLNAFSWMKMY